MNETLEYIAKKFEVDLNGPSPILIEKNNRQIMAQTMAELGFKRGAEIGVAQGFHSEILCQNMPGLHLYAVDVWDTYPRYGEYVNKTHAYYRQALQRLAPYNVTFMRKFSMEAVKEIPDFSLDFVYIDGAHDFKSAAEDIVEWTRKVRIGGIVYGHDYKRRHPPEHRYAIHVKDVIQAYTYAYRIKPWFVLGLQGNHPDGLYREGTQSWMFVRLEEFYLENYRV